MLSKDPATLARWSLQPLIVFHSNVPGVSGTQKGALEAAISPRMEAVIQAIIVTPDIAMQTLTRLSSCLRHRQILVVGLRYRKERI